MPNNNNRRIRMRRFKRDNQINEQSNVHHRLQSRIGMVKDETKEMRSASVGNHGRAEIQSHTSIFRPSKGQHLNGGKQHGNQRISVFDRLGPAVRAGKRVEHKTHVQVNAERREEKNSQLDQDRFEQFQAAAVQQAQAAATMLKIMQEYNTERKTGK